MTDAAARAARYAVYWAPDETEPLAGFGASWLGRDARRDVAVAQPAVPGLTPERLAEITRSPRLYGFHATLKPPFSLAAGHDEATLIEAAEAFARRRPAFAAAPLRLTSIGGFLALVPSAPSPLLQALADDAVRAFDAWRRPPEAAELARRRAAGLTPRQERYLARWGYPYVFEEFQFHLTLTERLAGPEHDRVRAALADLTRPFCREALPVRAVWLFRQDQPGAPFRQLHRFALA